MIEVKNVTSNANNWVAGETATIKFTVKNVSGHKYTKMYMNICVLDCDFDGSSDNSYYPIVLKRILGNGWTEPEVVSFANGTSKTFTSTFVIPDEVAKYFARYPNIRAVPIYIDFMDVKTTDADCVLLSDDLKILNCRFMPRIEMFSLDRSTGGVKNDEGESVLVDLKLGVKDTGFDCTNFFVSTIDYRENNLGFFRFLTSIPQNELQNALAGIADNSTLISLECSKSSDWNFRIAFGDDYERVSAFANLNHSFANLHLSGQPTGGACFGGFSSSEYGKPKLESHYPGYFYRGINGVNIFSEGEVLTGGRWVDNKPIYRKAIKLPAVAKNTSSTTGIIQVDPDIGHLLDYYGVVQRENGFWYPLNFRSLTNSDYQVDCYINADGDVVLRTGSGMALSGGYMICYYTKASDAAIEDDDGVAALVDETGATVADSAGVTYSVRAYNADVYQSQHSGSEIDSGIARALSALSLEGGTMTGPLILSGDPTVPFGAVTKQFLENELKKIELTPGAGVVDITITEVV